MRADFYRKIKQRKCQYYDISSPLLFSVYRHFYIYTSILHKNFYNNTNSTFFHSKSSFLTFKHYCFLFQYNGGRICLQGHPFVSNSNTALYLSYVHALIRFVHIYIIFAHIQIQVCVYSNEHCLNCFHFEFDLRCFRSSVCISFGLLLFAYTVVVDNYALSQL